MCQLALLRQHDPLPPQFDDGDELWIIQALSLPHGAPIGYAKILRQDHNSKPPLIEYVYVDSTRRRKGIAKSLIKDAIDRWDHVYLGGATSSEGEALISSLLEDLDIASHICGVL
ncbi:MAG: GNAT family N-acetyltransferase [Planctomycetes bacterium]|nr:GNAT family N-acetyltransferase [Planctomycetota bacterium]